MWWWFWEQQQRLDALERKVELLDELVKQLKKQFKALGEE
jgi:hypothetical protein